MRLPAAAKMEGMKELVFYVGLSCLLTHELDAMTNHEWRVLPIVRMLSESTGEFVFVVGHIPLFAGIIALVASTAERTRRLSRIGLCAFLAVHGIGHALSMGDRSYEFAGPLSNGLIFGAAVFGGLFLVLEWLDGKRSSQKPGT